MGGAPRPCALNPDAAHEGQVAELEAKVAAAERAKDEALQRRESDRRRAEGGLGRGEAGAGGGEGDEVGRLASRVREVEEQKGKLMEAKAAERRRGDKAEAAVEELQKKNQKLMSALMVQSGQVPTPSCPFTLNPFTLNQ